MTVTPPSVEELAAIADRYGLGLRPRDIGWFRELVAGALSSYDVVERLYAASVTASATSAEAIGWRRVEGRRTVVSSEVSNTSVFMNSKNWVACTMEYGVGP